MNPSTYHHTPSPQSLRTHRTAFRTAGLSLYFSRGSLSLHSRRGSHQGPHLCPRRWTSAHCPENDVFFVIKAFVSGVTLAARFDHILRDAFKGLTSPCMKEKLWHDFPFTVFVAMVAAIGTLMIDSLMTSTSNFYECNHQLF